MPDIENIKKEIELLKARNEALTNEIEGLKKIQAVGFVPKGVNWKLVSPNSVSPGHKHSISDISGGINIDGEYTAGEDISAGNAVSLWPDSVQDLAYSEANRDADLAIGDNSARTYIAQGFKPTNSRVITRVDLYLKKVGDPTDDLVVEIWSKTGTEPNQKPSAILNTKLTKSMSGSDLTTSYAYYSFDFDTLVELTAGTLYYIVIYRSGSIDSSNYYQVGVDDSNATFGGTNESVYAGSSASSWTETSTSDIIFKTYEASTTDDVLRLCVATSGVLIKNYLGVALDTITKGSTGTVRRYGNITGLSGLDPGKLVFISDTPGGLSGSAGTIRAPVGLATSTTAMDTLPFTSVVQFTRRVGGNTSDQSTTSSSETTLGTVTVPGGTIGNSGVLKITAIWEAPDNANNHEVKIKFAGNTLLDVIPSGEEDKGVKMEVYIWNLGSESSQRYYSSALWEGGTETAGHLIITNGLLSVDTTLDQDVEITAISNDEDTITLEFFHVTVEVE